MLGQWIEKIEIVPSTALEFYRNREDFWYGPNQQLGFRGKTNKYEAISIPHCQLVSPRAQHAYAFLEKRIKELNFAPYSILQHEGFLRYVIFRESKTHGKLVVVFNTFTMEYENEMEKLAHELITSKLADGIVWVHNPQLNDAVQGEIFKEWGHTQLGEKMSGIDFQYDVTCFFQTNPKTAEKAQEYVVQLVHDTNPNAHVLDLYCGVGLFSLPLGMKGHLVKGIELSKDSIIWARKNTHNLGLEEVSFEMGDVPKKLQELEKNAEKFDTVILDPPRSGLSKKLWRRVLRLQPTQLVYVACSLSALRRDLEWLSEYADFKIENAKAFDFFPHTEHVEVVASIHIEKIKELPKGG